MVGFLVTGHGNFATGILSSVELVAGEQENVIGVDFLKSYSTDDLKSKLTEAIMALQHKCEEIIIFTDLKGGSPYNVSVTIKMDQQKLSLEVICGTNFPMLLTGIFQREGITAQKLAETLIQEGRTGVDRFVSVTPANKPNDDEDGI